MRVAGSLLSLENTARKLGFLVVKLAPLEQGSSGCRCPGAGTRTVPGGRTCAAAEPRVHGGPSPAGGSALAAWGKKIEFMVVNGISFG